MSGSDPVASFHAKVSSALAAAALLCACSGSLDPGVINAGLSATPTPGPASTPSPWPDGDNGGGGGSGTPSTPPVITMINLKGGDYVAGGQVYKIYFSVHDESLGFNQSKIEYQKDGDADWKVISDRVSTVSDVEAEVDWPVCPQDSIPECADVHDGDGYRIRITTQGKDDLTATATSPGTFTIDSTAPSLTETGFKVATGFPKNGFLQMVLSGAQDSSTPIKDVCVKALDAADPDPGDACWTSIEAYGSTKALAPTAITITQYLGFFGGTYDYYVWARDSAGNTTTMTQNNNGIAAVVTLKNVASGLCVEMPTTTNLNGDRYVQKACADVPEQKFDVTIMSNGTYLLQNESSGRCFDDSGSTGNHVKVHQWDCDATNNNQKFTFVSTGTDKFKMLTKASYCVTTVGASTTSGALLEQATCDGTDIQNFNITVLEGAFSPDGTGKGDPALKKDKVSVTYTAPTYATNHGYWNDTVDADFNFNIDATAAAPNVIAYSNAPADDQTTLADPGSMVMSSKGEVYIRDRTAGIVKLDLINQTRSVLIPLGASFAEGTVGASATATLKNPLHIGIDEDDWLWIQDEDRIGYVDSSGQLKLAIGGGADTADAVTDPKTAKITYSPNMKWYGTFAVLPNKQIIFNSEDPHAKLDPPAGQTRFRLRVYYGNDGGRLDTIALSGAYGSQSVSDYTPYGNFAFTYDTDRKFIKTIVGRFCTGETVAAGTSCNGQVMLAFNPKGAEPTQISTHSLYSNLVLLGSLDTIYAFNAEKGLLSTLDLTAKTWSKTLGGTNRGSSYCANNSSSTSCNIRLVDAFITKQNRIFFMDQSWIRSVEVNGRVQTLYEP